MKGYNMPKWVSNGCVTESETCPTGGVYESALSRQYELTNWTECSSDHAGIPVTPLLDVRDSQRVGTDRSDPKFLIYRIVVRHPSIGDMAVQLHRFGFNDGTLERAPSGVPANTWIAVQMESVADAEREAELDLAQFRAKPPRLRFDRRSSG